MGERMGLEGWGGDGFWGVKQIGDGKRLGCEMGLRRVMGLGMEVD